MSVAKKAIRDFKKISGKPLYIIDIMLHYVDQGVNFTEQYGDIGEPFYNSMEKMFEEAIKLAEKTITGKVRLYACQKHIDLRVKKYM